MGGWSWTRQRAMIIKELWALLRDKKGRTALFAPPLIQLLLFSFAATLEVKNVEVGLLDLSGGAASAELVQRVAASPNISGIRPYRSLPEMEQAIDRQEVLAVMLIPPGFDAARARGKAAQFGIVLDGRRSNAAQITGSYISAIAGQIGAEAQPEMARAAGASVVTHWFNPNLEFIWFNLPGLIVIIISVSAVAITAQVVARERELGTFDQLLVSPLRVPEILIGKMTPTFLVGMANGLLFLVAAQVVFGVPFTGSLGPFLIAMVCYNISLIGVGMVCSAASTTMQQAFLGSFLVSVPIILVSGFASPIDNMPPWLQTITLANPARWFMEISHGSFLKGMPAEVVFSLTWPMVLIAIVTLSASAWMFRARME